MFLYRGVILMSTYLKKNEKRARARRQFLIILAAFITAVVLFLTGSSRMRSGQVQASSSQEICYTSVYVDTGDTLWEIADTYMVDSVYEDKNDYIDEIKEINHITEQDLQAGSYIIVPCTVTAEQS